MPDTFRIPAKLAAYCTEAAKVLASSERMLRQEYEWSKEDPNSPYFDPEWTVSIPHEEVTTCADNLKGAHEFLHWLGQFAENDPQPELEAKGGAA